MSSWPHVGVVGGSLGGLTAALVLRDLGCEVDVFERSSTALKARGAGIATHCATTRYFENRASSTRAWSRSSSRGFSSWPRVDNASTRSA